MTASPCGTDSGALPSGGAPLKVVHWTAYNKSGMNRVAQSLMVAERLLGVDSILMNVQENPEWDRAIDADVHVCHTYFPTHMRRRLTKPLRLVWVQHGTPEHVFEETMREARGNQYGMSDPWMVQMNYLQRAHARVTFWPRHQWFLQNLCDTGTVVHCVPMGIDHDFWAGGSSKGKFAGAPSVFVGENTHRIKWPFDLWAVWRDVYDVIPETCLHNVYLPADQHRLWMPYAHRSGAAFGGHLSALHFSPLDMRDTLKSVDFQIGLVRYGDFNRMGLEANVAGCKTISYRGNPYSDYWVTEGDQRDLRDELIAILRGDVQPRAKAPVPTSRDMAEAFIAIYRGILP